MWQEQDNETRISSISPYLPVFQRDLMCLKQLYHRIPVRYFLVCISHEVRVLLLLLRSFSIKQQIIECYMRSCFIINN